MADYVVKFSIATRDRFTLTLSLGLIPANIQISFTSQETRIIVLPDA